MTPAHDHYTIIGEDTPDAKAGNMFGKECFKINGKPFLVYYDQCIVCKLRDELHTEVLGLAGTQLFDPSKKNRPMREWIQIPYDYADRWAAFAGASYEYVVEAMKKG